MANATTRAKRLNETKMILRQPLLLIAIHPLLCAFAAVRHLSSGQNADLQPYG